MNSEERFSDELERWLDSDESKSLGALGDLFGQKSIAVAILLLMVVSATPVPTGGINLAFQIVAALIAGQMALGKKTLWLPKRWRKRELGGVVTGKAIPFIVRRIRWFEEHSRPRLAAVFHRRAFTQPVGVVLMALAIVAGLSPPFSGLETLPALGAVIIALAIILEDIVVLGIGLIVGVVGVAIFVSVGAFLVDLLQRIF